MTVYSRFIRETFRFQEVDEGCGLPERIVGPEMMSIQEVHAPDEPLAKGLCGTA